MSKTAAYNTEYFSSGIFATDYRSLALAIVETYHPRTVAEFGCGPGHLTRELAKLGVQVTAIDGYSKPDFSGLPISFYPLDLNDAVSITDLFTDKQFDLAISLEVAEHLQPESSPTLVNWLTKVAPIIIFSAAVPGQGGLGHINLRPRNYWHDLFTKHSFILADRMREKISRTPDIAPWYRYNVLDYIHAKHPQAPELLDVIHRLIASESVIATAYFEEATKLGVANAYLNYLPVKWYFGLRGMIKELVHRG